MTSPYILVQNLKMKKTLLYTLKLEVILHYITLTSYDIANKTRNRYREIETRSNDINIHMRTKYTKENKIKPLYTINVEVILHYITLTGYDIGNDT